MGKSSRRNRINRTEDAQCPVCFDVLKASVANDLEDNALACPQGHKLCTRCVANIVVAGEKCSPECIGFQFSCPLCRAPACVNKLHMMVIAKNSWCKAHAMFPCALKMEDWVNRV